MVSRDDFYFVTKERDINLPMEDPTRLRTRDRIPQ